MCKKTDKTRAFFDIKRLSFAFICTFGVLVLTHLPQDVMPQSLRSLQIRGLDKIEHIIAYGAICFSLVYSLKTRGRCSLVFLLLLFVIAGIATLDELTQPLVGRTASPLDWVADITGVIIVLFSFTVAGMLNQEQTIEPSV